MLQRLGVAAGCHATCWPPSLQETDTRVALHAPLFAADEEFFSLTFYIDGVLAVFACGYIHIPMHVPKGRQVKDKGNTQHEWTQPEQEQEQADAPRRHSDTCRRPCEKAQLSNTCIVPPWHIDCITHSSIFINIQLQAFYIYLIYFS